MRDGVGRARSFIFPHMFHTSSSVSSSDRCWRTKIKETRSWAHVLVTETDVNMNQGRKYSFSNHFLFQHVFADASHMPDMSPGDTKIQKTWP